MVYIIICFADIELIKSKEVQCMTTPESPLNPSKPCILPFKLYGKLHHECLIDVTTGNHWCPTELGDDGEFNFGEGKYGHCSLSCPPFISNTVDRPKSRIPIATPPKNTLKGRTSI